jgi:hypothetical protein
MNLDSHRVTGRQWWIYGGAVVLLLALHFWLAGRLIEQVNQDMHSTDQFVYLSNAWEARHDVWPFRTDAVRNNLWQWLVARMWLDRAALDAIAPPFQDEQMRPFFVDGKWFNVWLTAAFFAAFALVCARFFSLLPALNLLLLALLAVLLPRSVYFQPEALFFMLLFGGFICAWRLLVRNPLWLYALFGLLSALAYLAKPSTSLLLAVFIIASSIRLLTVWKPAWLRLDATPRAQWSIGRHFIGLAVFAVCHGAVIAPKAKFSYDLFRDPFLSFPSYWMWMDDWDTEAIPFQTRTRWGREIHRMKKEKLPSFRAWVEKHGWPAVWTRLSTGTQAKLENLLFPDRRFWSWRIPEKPFARLLPDRGVYLLLPLALVLGLAGVLWHEDRAAFARHPEGLSVALFGLGFFSAYTLAYGWYHVIGRGDRFMMTLYLPLLFLFMWGAEHLRRRVQSPAARWTALAVQVFILGCVATRATQLVLRPEFSGV